MMTTFLLIFGGSYREKKTDHDKFCCLGVGPMSNSSSRDMTWKYYCFFPIGKALEPAQNLSAPSLW